MKTPRRILREIVRARWEHRRRVIRESRIRGAKVHNYARPLTLHSSDPYHCVCNGTHVHFRWCPRCP